MKALIVILAILFLPACKVEGTPNTPANVSNGKIATVRLEDGTRCVVWDGYKAGGISCDWSNR